jgi:phosphatidylglycerophosphate synthase
MEDAVWDDLLRRRKDAWLAPLARALGPGVSPTAITLAAALVGLACAWTVAHGATGVALALWLANRLLDGLDGTLARMHGRQSDFGGYLDILLDFVVYAAVPLGLLAAGADVRLPAAIAWLLATFFVNAASWMYLSAVLERRQAGATARGELTTVTMPPGLVAGTETVLLYALLVAFPALRLVLVWTMAALVALTVVQRVAWARRHLG